MCNYPERTFRTTQHSSGEEQRFYEGPTSLLEIRVGLVQVPHEQGLLPIDANAARTEISWSRSSDHLFKLARYRDPTKDRLSLVVSGFHADSHGVRITKFQGYLHQAIKKLFRMQGQALCQFMESLVLLDEIRRAAGALDKLWCEYDSFRI